MTYDPENWLVSTTRTLRAWVELHLNGDLYDVIMEFPGAALDAKSVPLSKSLLHFEIDDMPAEPLGFGEGLEAENYDAPSKSYNPQYANIRRINFDVGIWTFDRTGGTTARMKLMQDLEQIFGPGAVNPFRNFSDAGDGVIDIIRFSGGRGTTDSINDVPVYRTINSELELRVVTRTKLLPEGGPTIEEISQAPNLTILG